MDAQHFDALARRLRSRRTILAGLAAGLATTLHRATVDDAGAKAKPCPKGKKRCGKRCIPKRTPCCKAGMKQCGKRCIARNKCCNHADCGARRLCAGGRCVIGQGTCQTGANFCPAGLARDTCSVGGRCLCVQSTAGRTRCVENQTFVCGGCVNDADCARDHPKYPGVVCVQAPGICGCGGSTVCMPPCSG